MNPHFWPDSFNVPKKTNEFGKRSWRSPSSLDDVKTEPSISRSEWTLLTKTKDSQRSYLLVVKDRNGKIIETTNPPEILLDGEVYLNNVSHAGVGKWKVTLDFPKEHSIIHVGFTVGEFRVERFRRIHWQLHELDRMGSNAYANKLRIRNDDKDTARVYLHLRDTQNFPIYQFHDFDLKLKVLKGDVKIEGPYSTLSGPYFTVKGKHAGQVKIEAWLDGQTFGSVIDMELMDTSRSPASAGECLAGLAKFINKPITPNAPLLEEYERLGESMVESYRLLVTPSDVELEENLLALSSSACVRISQLDDLRESVSYRLRQLNLKAHRTAQSKGNIHNMWNPHRSPQR